MNEIQTVISKMEAITLTDNILTKITEMNKDKIYPVSLIDIQISKNGITDNSEEVGEIIKGIKTFCDNVVKNTLDLESVQDTKKNISEMGKFIIETRKIQTNPLKEIAGKYTQHEYLFKTMNTDLTDKIDTIRELEYKENEKAIVVHFESLILECGEDLGMDIFKDFIANKRKINIFTTTGKLNKGIKDAIAEALRLVVEPIKQAKELEEKKNLQSKQFEIYFDGIEADGETQKLEANINTLIRMKETIEGLYPDIKDHCLRNIDNKIGRCESNIRANTAIKEKEEISGVDDELMRTYHGITINLKYDLDVQSLTKMKEELREIYPKLKFAENQTKVKELGILITAKIEEMSKPVEAKKEVILEEPERRYYVDISDIEFIANTGVVANSEQEAKDKLVDMLRGHLDMVGLICR